MTDSSNPVLFYHPDAYGVLREDLKGRHSAGESFLTAYLEQAEGPEVHALCRADAHFEDFAKAVKESGRPLTPRRVLRQDDKALRENALLHLPIPEIGNEARVRGFLGADLYAICGLTHTISSRTVLDAVADLCVAPVEPWDALICTSQPVHAALTSVLDNAEEHLRNRIGAERFTRPLMPVIPLGIHTRRFAHSDAERKRWRTKLGIADDAVAVLFFGRLSVHGKASPFQLAQALQIAAQGGRTRYEMIWCGALSNDFQQQAFMRTAQAMAPGARFHHVDGRKADSRFSIWSAADIFCSLSDNVQESFGLTVIEAMAARLPVIVSNWDGYRETVKHGVNGILVDSYMPPVSLADAGYRYYNGEDSYDQFIGGLSQFCIIDVVQTAHWLARLGGEPALRRKLGEAAQQHVTKTFDWTAILPRYRELWREQIGRLEQTRRNSATKPSPLWKIYDPAVTFAGFPSHRVGNWALLKRGPHFAMWDRLIKMPGIVLNRHVLLQPTELDAVRAAFAGGEEASFEEVLEQFATERRASVLRSLHWLVKIGLLLLVSTKSNR